ncbi:hypothetical protein G9A89_013876 [Geosiphon pyriformis]|nr:hypothetical protein G9A89_013876 [Geosiphon pyriformis]
MLRKQLKPSPSTRLFKDPLATIYLLASHSSIAFNNQLGLKKNFNLSGTGTRRSISCGRIIGSLLLNPFDAIKNLRAVQEIGAEALRSYEKIKLPSTHTLTRVPHFFGREKEISGIHEYLTGGNNITESGYWLVVVGANSVGKTALLREILADDRYHVIHFDLRLPGFADLPSFTIEFCSKLETFFSQIADKFSQNQNSQSQKEHDFLEDQAIGFKRFRLAGPDNEEKKQKLEQAQAQQLGNRNAEGATATNQNRSDLTKLLEKLQAALIIYHQVVPNRWQGTSDMILKDFLGNKNDGFNPNIKQQQKNKYIPVIFIDEAHKLKDLVNDEESLQIFYDASAVFTTQDRLCHIVHATSDPFYEQYLNTSGSIWLEEKVVHHTKFITIGDLRREEIKKEFHDHLIKAVPEKMRQGLLEMEEQLHEVLGGRIVDWTSFLMDYKVAQGKFSVESFQPFIRAIVQVSDLLEGRFSDKFPPESFIQVIQALIVHPHRISYRQLCHELNPQLVDELVRCGCLAYRMNEDFMHTMSEISVFEKPFLTASSPMMMSAMKLLAHKND